MVRGWFVKLCNDRGVNEGVIDNFVVICIIFWLVDCLIKKIGCLLCMVSCVGFEGVVS